MRQAHSAIDGAAVETARSSLPEPEILDTVVSSFRLLGDRTRALMLYALISGPLCVRDLALLAGVSESAVSHQLRLLREQRLVRAVRRHSNQIEYRLDDHHLAALFREAEFHADRVRSRIPDHSYPAPEPGP